MSGQGPLGDRHCLGEAFWLAARGVVFVALVVAVFVAMACQKPAERPDSNTVSDCAELGESRPEGCEE